MSRSSRRAKLERRRAALLHPMSESLERAFAEIEQGKPARAETTAIAPRMTQDGR
jgi:hypothetical protein